MPYIVKAQREKYDGAIQEIGRVIGTTPGNLNYVVTRICHGYLDNGTLSYQRINDVIGALECAKLELIRRRVNSYEDKKILENGDL